ncbi:MAG: phosphatidylglycerophosphatase A [Candidatus Omnitrophica bacterium]|nr:phosphatidylglycerophosphatase A [Candidatus Omnitrophota bacterium]
MPIREKTIKILATFFYVGYLPLIPGTFGSLAGLLLYYLAGGKVVLLTLVILVLGFLVSGEAERATGRKDNRVIVIDEVAGMLLSLLFVPFAPKFMLIGFLVFRFFDMVKPYPCGAFQKLKGSAGIMSDDIIAALYTNLALQLILRFASLRLS